MAKSPSKVGCLLLTFLTIAPAFVYAKQTPVVVDKRPTISPSLQAPTHGLKRKVAIARFTNETNYGRSFLLDSNENPIGKQCVDILSKKLLDTGKFILLERADMAKINAELGLSDLGTLKNAADYLIVGSITGFGRKAEGDVGILNRTKRQSAFAKVTIRLVDVQSGAILYSEEGSGEAYSQQKTVLGLGGRADYDTVLNDQALDAAITDLASKVIENLLVKPWQAYILAYSDGAYVITGSKSQGLAVGDTLDVYIQGKKIKNPQTGMDITMPGKKVGQIKIESFIGDEMNEVATAILLSGDIPKSDDATAYQNYILQEPK